MKIVYVAGPYIAAGFMGIEENIRKAEAAAIRLWNAGFGVFCPHLNTAHFEVKAEAGEQQYRDFDLRMLSACDAVFVLCGYQYSEGTCAKINEAKRLGIPVYHEEYRGYAALCGEQTSGPCPVEVGENP